MKGSVALKYRAVFACREEMIRLKVGELTCTASKLASVLIMLKNAKRVFSKTNVPEDATSNQAHDSEAFRTSHIFLRLGIIRPHGPDKSEALRPDSERPPFKTFCWVYLLRIWAGVHIIPNSD